MDVLEGLLAIILALGVASVVIGIASKRSGERGVADALGSGGVSLISNVDPRSLRTLVLAPRDARKRGALREVLAAFASGGVSLVAPTSDSGSTASTPPTDEPGPVAGAGA